MLSPLSLAPSGSPTPPGPSSSPRRPSDAAVPADAAGDVGGDVPSSSPRRADAADLRPGASAANDGCRCCCKPGPAAGAAASLGPPQPALQQAWARRSRRRCWPGGPAIAAPGGGELMHTSLELGINAQQRRTRTQRRAGPAENRIE